MRSGRSVFHAWLCLLLTTLFCTGCRTAGNSKEASDAEMELAKEVTTRTGIEMVFIPTGEFIMGDADAEDDDEKFTHRVTVNAFYMDKYEVTQEAYQRLVGKNPSQSKGPGKPVEQVNWLGAIRYCNLRSLREGLEPCYDLATLSCDFGANGYRLPTEAEWEYACRAGTNTTWCFGAAEEKLKDHAWFRNSSAGTTHPVGQKKPNAWGLYDLHGNVWEWCHDFYAEGYYQQSPSKNPRGPDVGEERVLRGGCWKSPAQMCRSSFRYSEAPGFAGVCFGADLYGFRCIRKP